MYKELNLMDIENRLNSIELFAGGGGILTGLYKAGFNCLLAIENNKWACETLKYNYPKLNILEKDIIEVCKNFEDIKKDIKVDIDLISGGFPCQSFSYAGKKLGFEDTRGTLFYNFALFVKNFSPKMFFAENVKGLLTHDKGKTFQTIIKIFEELGYHCQYKVLNSNDYGIAQNRERMIIIGIRKDFYKEDFVFPKPLEYKPILKDVLQDLLNTKQIDYIPYSEKKERIMKLVPMGGCWRDLPLEVRNIYCKNIDPKKGGATGIAKRLDINKPSLTILTSPSQKMTERCHPFETRPLTILESKRIQSFSDNYIFKGSLTEQYKQIGNAVPVLLSYHIGLSLKNYLIQNKEV